MAATQGHQDSLVVLVIDDHQIVGMGVEQALGSLCGGADVRWFVAVDRVQAPPGPFVAVLDLRLADGSTPSENLAALKAMGAPVVVYTSADDPVLVREAIAAGALSIVRKSAPPQELVDAVLAASQGQTMPGLDWAAALDADEDFVSTHLSTVEAQVLAHYASGEASDVVGRRLGISRNTVNTYVSRIRDKYRSAGRVAESRVDLFRRAAEDGLISYFDPLE